MSKRQKYEHAIALLENSLCQLDSHLDGVVGGPLRNIAMRRRNQICGAIVALGGDNPETESGGGPGEEGP